MEIEKNREESWCEDTHTTTVPLGKLFTESVSW